MSTYAHIQHQTEVFVFDNNLSEWFDSNEDVHDLLTYKLDIKKGLNLLEFAILGIYKIAQGNGSDSEEVYTLNAGRVFEIAMYDPKDNNSNKIFEDAYLMVHENLKTLAETKIIPFKNDFYFPTPQIPVFHEHLKVRLTHIF
jgi:hypothetical protein